MNNLDKVTDTIATYRTLPANGRLLVKTFIDAMEAAKGPAKKRSYQKRKVKRAKRTEAA